MFDASIRRKLEIALFSEPEYFWDDQPARVSNSLTALLKRAKIDTNLRQSIERQSKIQAEALGCSFVELAQKNSTLALIFKTPNGDFIELEEPSGS